MDSTAFIRDISRDPDNIIKNTMRSILLAMFLNQLLLNTATLVDAIIIGRFYSDASLGACGIISNLVFFNVTLGSIFAVGSQLECASALSNGELLRAREVFSASIYLILILTMILTAFSLCFPQLVAAFFGASEKDPEIYAVTTDYVRGLAFGFPADYLVGFFSAVMLLDGSKVRLLVSAAVMILVNIGTDFLNVFVLKWGLFGIGTSTAISNYCALAVLLLYFVSGRNLLRMVRVRGLADWFKVFFVRSFSSLMGRVMKLLYFVMQVRIIVAFASSDSFISYSAFNNFRNMLICVCLGLGSANLLISSVMYSEKNVRGLRQAFQTGIRYCLLLGFALGGMTAILARPLAGLYGLDTQLDETVLILRIYGIFFFVEFLKFFYSFYTRAINKKGISIFYNVFGEFFIPTLSALVLGILFGVDGIWIAIPIGSFLAVISVIIYSRKKNGKTQNWKDDLMLLPQSFFAGQDRCLNVSPRRSEDISIFSESTRQFLLDQKYSARIAGGVALSIEEILVNIRDRAETDRIRNTNLFVTLEEEKIRVRIRCDGQLFNPLSVIGNPDAEDPVYGPSLIQQIADSIEYNSSLGMNNLIITFDTGKNHETNRQTEKKAQTAYCARKNHC
ncbi:MAG: hypothetical protein IK082_12270 [Oscillospiraceae bacterium]|nr:hypothetical protein [Oscillospiraceae bacterium]